MKTFFLVVPETMWEAVKCSSPVGSLIIQVEASCCSPLNCLYEQLYFFSSFHQKLQRSCLFFLVLNVVPYGFREMLLVSITQQLKALVLPQTVDEGKLFRLS